MSGVVSKVSTSVTDSVSALRHHIQDHVASLAADRNKVALTVAAAVSGAVLLWKLTRSSSMPPGPPALPLIGNMHQMGSDPRFYIVLHNFKKKHGDIMTVYFGPKPIVFLNSPDLVREAFMRQSDITSNRMYSLFFQLFSEGGQDIAAANYCPRVQIQRKLAHQALRKFSQGGGLEKYLVRAFDAMAAELDEDPRLVSLEMGFKVAYNILLSMCFGKEFSFEDPFFKEMFDMTKELDDVFEQVSITDAIPFMRHFPLGKTYKLGMKIIDKFRAYMETTYQEHLDTFDKGKITDFTYQLISVMKETENDPNERSNLKLLTRTHYIMTLNDLFFAGTDTSRLTMSWIWHYLAAYPEVQRRAQEEVDSVLGRDGTVSAECREKLPYVDAMLHEVMRIRPVVPAGLFHETTAPIELGGYHIPKGTGLASNTWSIHMDEKNWADPEAFLPERWLDENGKYVFQSHGFVPFSMGRRSCIGESFVKIELHMLTTMLLQRYTLEPSPGYTVSLELFPGSIVKPEEQPPLIAKKRR